MPVKALFLLDPGAREEIYGARQQLALARRCNLICPPLHASTWRSAPVCASDAEAIFTGWGMVMVDEEFLAAFPRLKILFFGAGSIRHFTTNAMWERGVRITTATKENAESVAEYTLAQILLGLKQVHPLALAFREHVVPSYREKAAGNFGSTVGLISLGAIGQRVARWLQHFKHRVIAYDPYVSAKTAAELGVELVDLDTVFSRSDLVSCHAPLLDATNGLLREEHFSRLKPGAVFLNTARGAVVNEPDLCRVLANRPDLFAFLDVTWPEPPAADSPLRTLKNVLLTPHIAGCVGRECERMGAFMVSEFDRYVAGQPLIGEVTRERAALLA